MVKIAQKQKLQSIEVLIGSTTKQKKMNSHYGRIETIEFRLAGARSKKSIEI